MLAPRKTLWSSPPSVVEYAAKWVELRSNDVVCDIGCGDGRVLIQWAAIWSSQLSNVENDCNGTSVPRSSVKFVGLDINLERIQHAEAALQQARKKGSIHRDVSVTFHCANALDATHLIENATVFFLYLVPRGLRLIKPILLKVASYRLMNKNREGKFSGDDPTTANENDEILLRVVTYMSQLPGESFAKRELCQVEHQPGANWPVYLYHLKATSINQKMNDKDTG